MKPREILIPFMILISSGFLFESCISENNPEIHYIRREPALDPDYSGVTIPPNIAQLNFRIREEGKNFRIRCFSQNGKLMFRLKSNNGIVQFPRELWRKLLCENRGKSVRFEITSDNNGNLIQFNPFFITISRDSIDPYICYRLLYPGYESWSEMQLIQRSVEDFRESVIFENRIMENNCFNCHTFLKNDPGKFFLHVRGSLKGTYFINGRTVTRRILRTDNLPANTVYPAWHPGGRYIVFSSNAVVQSFNMIPGKRNEIYDQFSRLVIYDSDLNTISAVPEMDTIKYMDTFPCWAPGGDYLYFCRTKQVKESFDFMRVKYDLFRRAFDQSSGLFGEAEMVFNANEIDKSITLPAISPDGNYLLFVLHDYGTFSIWHKEADLYLLDLKSGKVGRMTLNSDESESYHAWSSNGNWILFSSKRTDGITARPYFTWFGSPDNVGKPFVLPQKDPALYDRLAKTFNRPEFITGKIMTGPREFEAASGDEPTYAVWNGPLE